MDQPHFVIPTLRKEDEAVFGVNAAERELILAGMPVTLRTLYPLAFNPLQRSVLVRCEGKAELPVIVTGVSPPFPKEELKKNFHQASITIRLDE